MKACLLLVTAIAIAGQFPTCTYADAVTDWNAALATAQKATGQASNALVRPGAIVNAAIFDAVNGVARKYHPYFVIASAPTDANQAAAAVQAAYTTLLALYPDQKSLFETQLTASLAGLSSSPESIAAGRKWGESVALKMLAWRTSDGIRNDFTFFGGTQPGYWRTPTPGQSGIAVNLGTLVPFTMKTPTQFRPVAPYGSVDRLTALTSAAYAADLNEVKTYGGTTSTVRSAAQTELARFWQVEDESDEIRALISLVAPDALLVDNARLFALCTLAAADAGIVCFDAKYAYGLWRPIDAIHLADTDDNPGTEAVSGWRPLITTPRHPEYPAAHPIFTATLFGMAALVLGNDRTFTLKCPTYPSVTRTFTSFSAAIDEVVEARIWAGLHFRASGQVGRDLGHEIANHAYKDFLRPLDHGERWPSPEAKR